MPTVTTLPDPPALAGEVRTLIDTLCDVVADARESIAELRALSGRPLVSGLYSIEQAAERLGMSTSKAYSLIGGGHWPAEVEVLRLGGTLKVRVSEVDAYLAPRQAVTA